MAASAAAIAARSPRPPCFVRRSTAPRSSSIPAAGTAASRLYASASSAGCSAAAKPAGSPLRKTVDFESVLPLLLQGEGGGRSPSDEGAARRRGGSSPANPHPNPSPVGEGRCSSTKVGADE